jgi:hypothetical protein
MNSCDPIPKERHPALRWALLVAGCAAVVLAVIGMVLPVLPTVPFLLLALACFARSSARIHAWLIGHASFGPLVRPYLQGAGLPRRAKVRAIALLWGSIGLSVLFLLEETGLRVLLLAVALGVTLYLLYLPTTSPEGAKPAGED